MSDSAWPLQVTAILLVGFVATRCDFQSVKLPDSSRKVLVSDKVLRNKNIADFDTLSMREKTDLNNTIELRSNLLRLPPLAVAPDNSVIRLSELRLREKHVLHSDGYILVDTIGGNAVNSGIRPGDIILSVNKQRIYTIKQFMDVMAEGNKRTDLLVRRDGNDVFITLKSKQRASLFLI